MYCANFFLPGTDLDRLLRRGLSIQLAVHRCASLYRSDSSVWAPPRSAICLEHLKRMEAARGDAVYEATASPVAFVVLK